MRWWTATLAVACADPNGEPADDGGLAWEPCPLFVEGRARLTAQCATARVPLRWEEPEGETIELFVQRRLTGEDNPRQLWMLAGGPGQSSAVYETYVQDLDGKLAGTDLYLFEHRGVGRSTRLGCPAQEADDSDEGIDVSADEWPDCLDAVVAEHGDGLQAFTIDEAAHDLDHLVGRLRGEQQVFVYGGSYGTTLAHRFLQHHPDAVDGVILDSLAIDVDHRVYDVEFDQVGQLLMAACGEDERCAEALGPDPYARALEVLQALPTGPCADLIDASTLRAGAAAFLADAGLRGFAPSLFARVGRCTADDREEIGRLLDLFLDRAPHYTERLYSPVLFTHIELSEQWPEPWPAQEALDAEQAGLAFSFDVSASRRFLLDLWPRYPLDPVAGGLADTDTPLLMLHGGLDPQTPLWRTDAARGHFTGPGQHFVEFPLGTHILLGSTPGRGGDCATQLVAAFLEDPSIAPDASCVDTLDPIDFTGQPLTSKLLFTDCSRYGDGCAGRGSGGAMAAVFAFGWRLRRRGARDRQGATCPRPASTVIVSSP